MALQQRAHASGDRDAQLDGTLDCKTVEGTCTSSQLQEVVVVVVVLVAVAVLLVVATAAAVGVASRPKSSRKTSRCSWRLGRLHSW